MLTGSTINQRKRSLATLVVNQLRAKGHTATIIENRKNTLGHTDRIAVASDRGLIHITATGTTDPNGKIKVSGYHDRSQDFLADKDFVAFGWKTRDNRTFLMIIDAKHVAGRQEMAKSDIVRVSNTNLSVVLK